MAHPKGAVYRNSRLMPGSLALELHQAGKQKELDAHMKRLEEEDRKRSGVVESEKGRAAREHFEELLAPCCLNEKRNMRGGCVNCGAPCL